MSSAEDFWKFLLLDDPAMQNFFVVRYIMKMESWRRKAHSTWTTLAAGPFKIVNERVAHPITNKTQPS
jgi:hypothetical protein